MCIQFIQEFKKQESENVIIKNKEILDREIGTKADKYKLVDFQDKLTSSNLLLLFKFFSAESLSEKPKKIDEPQKWKKSKST